MYDPFGRVHWNTPPTMLGSQVYFSVSGSLYLTKRVPVRRSTEWSLGRAIVSVDNCVLSHYSAPDWPPCVWGVSFLRPSSHLARWFGVSLRTLPSLPSHLGQWDDLIIPRRVLPSLSKKIYNTVSLSNNINKTPVFTYFVQNFRIFYKGRRKEGGLLL